MCTCASCEATDKLAKAGFAEWPKGNPAGRKAAAEYASHVAYGRQWGKGRVPELPAGLWDRSPFPCTGTHHGDPGAYRVYPGLPDVKLGTASYVQAFIAANGYATAAKIAERKAERAKVERWGKITRIKPAPRLVQLARDLRRQAEQERRAA